MRPPALALLAAAALCAACVRFEYDASVSAADRARIEAAVAGTEQYLDAQFDGHARSAITIAATAAGACGGGASSYEGAGRICISTGSAAWPGHEEQAVASAYFAALEDELGCGGAPAWLVGGAAAWLGLRVASTAQGTPWDDVVTALRVAVAGERALPKLRALEEPPSAGAHAHLDALYALAFDRLMLDAPFVAMRRFCEAVARGATWPDAFASSFGQSASGFEASFDAYRRLLTR